jgi:hypothetical protein
MPSRKFVYSSSGVVDVTPSESRALCDELSADVASRTANASGYSNRGRNVSLWPVHSDSMGCDSAEQAKQEQAELRKHGVNTEYDSKHRPIWMSRAHKKAYHRALGYADPDAGYGDAEPVNFHSGIKRVEPRERLERARQALIEKEYRLFGQRVSSI